MYLLRDWLIHQLFICSFHWYIFRHVFVHNDSPGLNYSSHDCSLCGSVLVCWVCVAMPWLVVRGRDLQNVFCDLNSVNTDRMGGAGGGGGLPWIHSIGGDWFSFSHSTLIVEITNTPHPLQINCRVQEDPIDVIVCSLWSCMFCRTKSSETLARPVSPSSETLFKLFTAFWILSLPPGETGGYFHLLFPSLLVLVQCRGCALRVMSEVVSKSMQMGYCSGGRPCWIGHYTGTETCV